MAGITRTLNFAEGVETGGPTTSFLQATEFAVFANDAAYVSSKGAAAEDGDTYYNSTDHVIRFYKNGSWTTIYDVGNSDVVTLTDTQTLTNKTLQLGEAVDLTSTSTELNQLDGVSVGGNSAGDILTTDDTQTLTNKTLTSPSVNGSNLNFGTASNTNRILLPSDTAANLDLLTDVAGLLAYDTTSNLISFNNGSLWTTISPAGVDSLVTKTTTYTATTSDRVILCDSSGGAFTITLYATSGNAGRRLVFIKTTSDYSAVTIDGNAAETINGNATTTINTQYERLTLVCDGTNWIVEQREADTGWQATTADFTWSSGLTLGNGTKTLLERRDGDSIEIQSYFNTGSTSVFGGIAQIVIPTGLTISSGDLVQANAVFFSAVITNDDNLNVSYQGSCFYVGNSTTIEMAAGDAGQRLTNTTPYLMATGDKIWITVRIPIDGWKGQNE